MEANKKNTNKKNILVVMLVFTLLGIVFALQFRSVAHTQKTQNEKTSAEILQYQKTIEELEKKITDNKETNGARETRYDSERDNL
mgnify:CR=1 FL=1